MHFSTVIAASLVVPLVAAHGDHIPGAPKIFGLGRLRAREGHAKRAHHAPRLSVRQGGTAEHRCGPAFGGAVCDEGYCCSSGGWCGTGKEYCQAPDCLFEYGPACDANILPSGGSTRNIARPVLGDVPYGQGIFACKEPGTVAITYDDGPYVYTDGVLDLFKEKNFKATFFVTGVNIGKGAIDDPSTPWPAVIKRMDDEGHQIASHTWSHQDLSAITQEQRIDQMVKLEMALSNIIGKFPTYMRPPYSSCNGACETDMKALGYVISYFDLDTDDYNNVTPDKIQNAKDRWDNAINPSNSASDDFLAIAHDIHQQTAQNLTVHMLDLLESKGYRGVTMGECMGEPEANWYRAGNGRVATSSAGPSATASGSATATSSTVIPTASGVSPDGSCGSKIGFTCAGSEFGSCCSVHGWCGSTSDHCGVGCQTGFGTCEGSSGSSSIVSSSVSSAVSSSVASSTSSVASTTSASAPTSAPTGPVSTDGTCGGNTGSICLGSAFGDCCSEYGWCGASTVHCGTGCNPLFGKCTTDGTVSSSAVSSSVAVSSTVAPSSIQASSTSSSAPTATPSGTLSPDGSCGGAKGYSCIGFEAGDCCSEYGWCGATPAHCGTGCNPLFGKCAGADTSSVIPSPSAPAPTSSSAPTSSAPASSSVAPTSTKSATPTPSATPKKTVYGTCGGRMGYTCEGWRYGECCSFMGLCGSTRLHCAKSMGCNPLFGKCT